ncbi:MAG: hypothetical protein ABJN62_18460 [Halioglobus sp.]
MNSPAYLPKRLFSELRRRRVFRAAALYVVGTWLVLQVADVVFPALSIPEESIRYILIAGLLGFPAALVFGWYFDITPEGISRTAPVDLDQVDAHTQLSGGDYLVLLALVAVVTIILYGAVSNIAPEPVAIARTDGPPMVAVLPFTTVSQEGDSEFFAYGIHDDLLTQLAHLQSLRVISRTSVLEYKGTVKNIRDIGAELGADAILEGGVQSSGGRIRINAQLIDARTDEHLWANTFDRELTTANIFDVQGEIARAIAVAMNATLTEQEQSELSTIPTENMAAYRAFRTAMRIRDTRGSWLVNDFREALEKAIELDPGFTAAMAELVGYLSHANFFYETYPEYTSYAERLLDKIHLLEPGTTAEYFATAYYTYYVLRDFEGALELVNRAIQLSPSNVRLLHLKSWIQRRQGDFDGRLETMRQAVKLDPRDLVYASAIVTQLMLLHRYDDAAEELKKTGRKDFDSEFWRSVLSLREHQDIKHWEAEQLALFEEFEDTMPPEKLWEAHILSRNYDAAEALIPQLGDEQRGPIPYLSDRLIAALLVAKLKGDTPQLERLIGEAQAIVDETLSEMGDKLSFSAYFDMATLAAMREAPELAEKMARRALGAIRADRAQMMNMQSVCQIFAMVGRTTPAVECLREAFSQPSYGFAFMEPYHPAYDPIRSEPSFVAVVTEFGVEQGGSP